MSILSKKWLLLACYLIFGRAAGADLFDQYLHEIFESNLAQGDEITISSPGAGLGAWIDNPQARLVADNIDDGSVGMSYRIRFNPILRKEQRAQKAVTRLRQDRQKLRREQQTLQKVSNVYRSVLDIVENEHNRKNIDEQIDLLNLSAQYHRDLVDTDEFNPERLQEVIFDIDRANKTQQVNLLRMEQLLLIMQTQSQGVNEEAGGELELSSIIEPDEIHGLLQLHEADWVNKAMSRQAAVEALTSRILQGELELAREQSDFGFNLMELELNNDSSGNSIGVTFGFRLPNIGSNREVVRRQLNLMEAGYEYDAREYAITQQVNESLQSIELNFIEWSGFNELLSKHQEDEISDSVNPEMILTASEERSSLSQRASASYLNILRAYVDLISFSGVVTEQPLRNWLKTGQPLIADL